ncbi:MAG: hypothetical protein AAB365_00135 [Patescibacteria group bacterium]
MPLSPTERKELLTKYHELDRNLSQPHKNAFDMTQLRAMSKERDAILDEYGQNIPLISISRCPICQTVLEYPFDDQGLNGPWWEKGPLAEYPKPHGCTHFRVLLGAIDFGSKQPVEASSNDMVVPGPGAPFVVPRMLEKIPSMKAVISKTQLFPGYTCYLIAYFSESPVHGSLLHQPWGREAYQVLDEKGEYEGWFAANDIWDFDLLPWIKKGVLQWISSGDTTLTLHDDVPCEFLNLPGVHLQQFIERGVLKTKPLPTGEPLQPFE